MYFCQGTYALCTSAPCVPIPNSNQATCSCEVLQGSSMAGAPCDTVAPGKDSSGNETVYSMFSLAQFNEGDRVMFCAKDKPWSWCLDKPCTVDPKDPGRASCICDIVTDSKHAWLTLGGDCNTSTCDTAYWSAATLEDFDAGTKFLRSHGQDIEPQWCEGSRP
ncbi:hypothetical protein [Enhygromyxa salina]|nr:hypothetical protein [Enhygromyxa salina]